MKLGIKRTNPGWEKTFLAKLKKQTGKEVAVGFPAGMEGIHNPHYKNGASITEVAIYNNFGTDTIPRRPFMEKAAQAMKEPVGKLLEKRLTGAISQNRDIETVLEEAGQLAAGIIKETITDLDSPPNAPVTIAKKKSSNPLIDTGAMRQHVTHHVRKKS